MGTNIISRRKPLQANIGVFGVGYWSQAKNIHRKTKGF
jgi:hypothetical protein